MKRVPLSLPELAIVAGTRAAAGAGLGLLLADKLEKKQRRAIGWTLLAVGVLSTIPIAMELFGEARSSGGSNRQPDAEEPRA